MARLRNLQGHRRTALLQKIQTKRRPLVCLAHNASASDTGQTSMLCAENMCKLLRATSNYSHMQNMPATLHRSNIHGNQAHQYCGAKSCKTLALTCSCPLPFVAALGSWFHTLMISEHQSYWLVSVTSLHVRNHHQRLHTPRRPPGCRVCARSCTGPGRLYRAGGDVPATRANRKAGRTFTGLCFNVLARCW